MESKTARPGPSVEVVLISSQGAICSLQLACEKGAETFDLSLEYEAGLGRVVNGFERVSSWLWEFNNEWAVRPIGRAVRQFDAGEDLEFPFVVSALDEVFSFARPLGWCPRCRNGRLLGLKGTNGNLFLQCEHCLGAYEDVNRIDDEHSVRQVGEIPLAATDEGLRGSQWQALLPSTTGEPA